jgi:uncharacterized protein
VECAMAGEHRVLVVAQRRGADNDPNTLDSLYPVGVTASVINPQTQVDVGSIRHGLTTLAAMN